jgi:hypothetical protein
MRENEARVEELAAVLEAVLERASEDLTILNPEDGEEELIQAVAAELARLRALLRSV